MQRLEMWQVDPVLGNLLRMASERLPVFAEDNLEFRVKGLRYQLDFIIGLSILRMKSNKDKAIPIEHPVRLRLRLSRNSF
jgi:hypothetical protein